MTISSVVNKNQYVANGSTTVFIYTFRIITENDIKVVLTNTSGVDTVQTITTNYTVTGVNSASGGTVVFTTAPASGYRVTLVRNAQALQPEHYVENDPFPAASHEIALDRLTTVAQTALEQVSRGLQVSVGTDLSSFNNALPGLTIDDAGKAIIINSTATGFLYATDSAGDVFGPVSSTDDSVVRFNGTSGKDIQDSVVIINDAGDLTTPASITAAQVNGAVVNATDLVAINGTINTLTAANYIGGNANLSTVTAANVIAPIATIDALNTDTLTVYERSGVTGAVILRDSTGANYVAVKSPDTLIATTIYKLPTRDGLPTQVLHTDGLGNLYWSYGTPTPVFMGTLATLEDVSFFGLSANDFFATPNGGVWTNLKGGVASKVQPYDANISFTDTAETRSAQINMADNQLIEPVFREHTETVTTVNSGLTTTLDISTANLFIVDHDLNTTFIFANPSVAGSLCSFTLLRRKDATGTARTATWPASVRWPNGAAPTLTQTASAVDAFIFRSYNNGTSWFGYAATLDFI